jgi:hypothetical protein
MKPKCEHKWKIHLRYSDYVLIDYGAWCEVCHKEIDVPEILHRLNEYSAMKRELKAVKNEFANYKNWITGVWGEPMNWFRY